MNQPARQTSAAPNRGPTRTKEVIDPIVDDLEELFSFADAATDEINSNTLEIKKLQNAPPGAGAGSDSAGGSFQAASVFANGVIATGNINTEAGFTPV